MNGYRLATHFHCTARKKAPCPLSHQVAPRKNAHQTAFASSCASQKCFSPAFTSPARAKTPLACFHVASPAQALHHVRFNISFILYCDVDHGFVLSMIFCFFRSPPAGILAPLVAVGRFAPSAERPQRHPWEGAVISI